MNQEHTNRDLIQAAEEGDHYNAQANNGGALRRVGWHGHTETIRPLLQTGVNVHPEYNPTSWFALHGHEIIIEAFVSTRDISEYSLIWAVLDGCAATVQMLLQEGADPAYLSFPELKEFLTPKFLLSLPDEILARIENCHPEVKKYEWGENKNCLKGIKNDKAFDAKISLADFYYRPGAPGYYQAISFNQETEL